LSLPGPGNGGHMSQQVVGMHMPRGGERAEEA
jgi:hypothetical protein